MRALVGVLVVGMIGGCGGVCDEPINRYCSRLLRCQIVDSKGFDSCVGENKNRAIQVKATLAECSASADNAEKTGCCTLTHRVLGEFAVCAVKD